MKPKDENKIAQFFQATLQIVARHGLVGVSMAAVAKEAGLGAGTIYTYFESKEDLIHALYRETKKCTSINLCSQAIESIPVKLLFKEIWMNFLRYRIENYEEGFFQHQYIVSPYMNENEENRMLTQRMLEPVFIILERGKNEGIIKNVDNKLLFAQISGFASALVDEIHAKRLVESEFMLNDAFAICWDALKA